MPPFPDAPLLLLADRATAAAMAGLALALALRSRAPDGGGAAGLLAAALAVAALAACDVLGLHGHLAKAAANLLPLEAGPRRAAGRLFKVLLLAPVLGSALAVFALALRGRLRAALLAWLGALAAAGALSELGGAASRSLAGSLGPLEEAAELAATLAALAAATAAPAAAAVSPRRSPAGTAALGRR